MAPMFMESKVLRRIVWNVLPALMVVGAVWMALAGEAGLLNRHALKQRLLNSQDRVAQIQQQNHQLRAQIESLRTDPNAMQLSIADQLLMAEKGSTIYRFQPEAK